MQLKNSNAKICSITNIVFFVKNFTKYLSINVDVSSHEPLQDVFLKSSAK